MGRSVTLQGTELALEGPELRVGEKAPDATLRKDLVSDFSLGELKGKKRIYSVVPSLDTPVCALQTKRFNEEMGGLSDVEFVTVSCDLPTAVGRFCGAEGIDAKRMHTLSDHKETEFGRKYGTLIPELRVECRAVFVVGADDMLHYVEYVPEVAEHPDYDAILECVRDL